eukprot:TRINITY_DN1039_c1_g3_i1.p1 TRINITY_DN1039_c1_g3~~TRINITY_DN1039_c1_g3_i1.p1  ORF type:complete len:998 (+),score=312.60 TRINITY_DN1039_c1_g3_i1:681-3674(+)
MVSVRTGECKTRSLVDGKQKGATQVCAKPPPYWTTLSQLTSSDFPTYVQQSNGVIVPDSIKYSDTLSDDAKQALSNIISQLDFDVSIIGSGPIDRKREVYNADAMKVSGQDPARYTVIEHGHQKQVEIDSSHLHLLDFHRGYFAQDLCHNGQVHPSTAGCQDPSSDCAECVFRNGDRRLVSPDDYHEGNQGRTLPRAQPGDKPPISPGRRQNYALFVVDCNNKHGVLSNQDMLLSLHDEHHAAMSDFASWADNLIESETNTPWAQRTDCDSGADHGVVGSLAADYIEFPDMGGSDSAVMIRALSYTSLAVPGADRRFNSKMADLIAGNRKYVTDSDSAILTLKRRMQEQAKTREQEEESQRDPSGGGDVVESSDGGNGFRDAVDLSDVLLQEQAAEMASTHTRMTTATAGAGGSGVDSLPPVQPQPAWAKEVVKRNEGMFTLALKKPFIKRFGGSKGGGEIFVMPRISVLAAQTRIRSMDYAKLNSVGTLFGGYLRIKAFFLGKEWTVFENVALILALYLQGPKKWQVRPMIFGPNPPGKPLLDLFKLFTKGKKDKGAQEKAAPPPPPANVQPDPNTFCRITKDPFFSLFNLQIAGRQYRSTSRSFNQRYKKPGPKVPLLSPKFRFMIGPVPVAVGIDLGISIYAGLMADTCTVGPAARMGAGYVGANLEVVGTIATPSLSVGLGAQVYVKLVDLSLTAGGEMSADFKEKCMAVTPVIQGPSGTVGLYLQIGNFRRQWIVAAWYGKRYPGTNLYGTCPLGSGNTEENTAEPDVSSFKVSGPCFKQQGPTLTGVRKFPGTYVYKAEGATPIWYRREADQTWSWTPYEPSRIIKSGSGSEIWMPVTNNVVCRGQYKGKAPVEANLKIINELYRLQTRSNSCSLISRRNGLVVGTRACMRPSPLHVRTPCGTASFSEWDQERSMGKFHVSWYKKGFSVYFRRNPSTQVWEWQPKGGPAETFYPITQHYVPRDPSKRHSHTRYVPAGAKAIMNKLRCVRSE